MSKPHLRPTSHDIQTADSFQNFLTRTGIYAGNIGSAGMYGFNPVTRNRVQMEWLYRSSWIGGVAVDVVAHDMTREGVEVQCDDGPDRKEELREAAARLGIWKGICDTLKWSRLYGGAVGFLMIDGQDPSTPLRIETIGQGQFKGILPLDRWLLYSSVQDLVTQMGPEFGLPRFYEVVADGMGMPNMRIHHSRVIRQVGVELPYWQRIAENLWGMSVIERLWDRLIAFDSATQGTAQLVYKAHLRTYSVDGLREIIASGGPALEGLVKQIAMIRAFQSNEGMTLMDTKDKFEAHQYAFGGLNEVILQFGEQIAGALGVPLVRLFGQSPGGLNSTGESDMRIYYDGIKQQQQTYLGLPIERVYQVLYRSTFGVAPPKNFHLKFAPLWQLGEAEKATVANQKGAVVLEAFEKQVIDRPTAMKELRQLASTTGVFSNITDEQIKDAEEQPAPTPEQLAQAAVAEAAGNGAPGADGGDEGSGAEGNTGAAANGPRGRKLRAVA